MLSSRREEVSTCQGAVSPSILPKAGPVWVGTEEGGSVRKYEAPDPGITIRIPELEENELKNADASRDALRPIFTD